MQNILYSPERIPAEFVHPLKFMIFNCFWSWALGEITGNVSQVDRVWTFLPVIYTGYFTFYPLLDSAPAYIKAAGVRPRVLLMFTLQVCWMLRLSYNTYRRGLFSLKDEDYRWAVLRQKIPPWLFKVFNLSFIAITQNILLFLLGIPAAAALRQPLSANALGTSDYVLAVAFLITLGLEFVSDNQQFAYQSFKHATDPVEYKKAQPYIEWPGARLAWTEADRKRGFVTRGLWAWCRHPNFLCEQTIWFLVALFPVLSAPAFTFPPTSLTPLGPIVPAIALSLLFVSSTAFTEAITLSKYPVEYAAYQERVGMFLPFVTGLKGAWLAYTGRKDKVEAMVWGRRGKQE
ncbi:hypothetical protein BOTBODRAFT_27857 [Botryobasidium botryosum FD-172 SS1]|uniref:Steroid 5-alpha reductase C-terminal domain-containing protein n=1 Tax=Botryobasidium botryosum (strain FD-172 SS1) TaxID=930990 RepID=A0A067N580_BOTB1|nr:hypothetical protein BOTBODRAFT_27857 [Botryobasidium botryosum FD-172 SS1]